MTTTPKTSPLISLKPGRVGGLTACLAIHDRCHDACTPCWVGATPQTAIGCRTDLALGAKENCEYPAEFFAADQVLAADIAEPLLPTKDADGRKGMMTMRLHQDREKREQLVSRLQQLLHLSREAS